MSSESWGFPDVIDLVYGNDEVLVVFKPSQLPTVPLKGEESETLLSLLARQYPEVLSIHGRQPWEGGVLHRLDTPTSGLVLVARTQRAFDALLVSQLQGRIEKQYRAIVEKTAWPLDGFEPFPFTSPLECPVTINSYFRSYGPHQSAVRPVYEKVQHLRKKEVAVLYTTICSPESATSVICSLSRGFRHQVRAHLAWAGHPIIGDTLYGAEANDQFGLSAIALTFDDPLSGKRLTITL